MNTILNNFLVTGKINNLDTTITSNIISVEVPSSQLSISKLANKNIWSDGILKYSITITNNSNSNIINGTFKDVINPKYANVIPSSVLVNNSSYPFTYNKATGQLEINNLNKQVKEQSEFINVQGNQINKCNAENSSLYNNYLELEEKNMVLEAKNKIYEKESETKGNN